MYLNITDYLSKYRASIMGLAITWVVLYHFGVSDVPILSEICQNGFIGVDIFMLLSGFGLYHSLWHSEKCGGFYARRCIRIFPVYVLFGIIVSFAIGLDEIWAFFLKVSTVGFWIGGDALSYEWFVPSIIILYLIFPLVYNILKGTKYLLLTALLALSLTTAIMGAIWPGFIPFPYFLLVYRLPEFILGALIAHVTQDKKVPWIAISVFCFSVTVVIEYLIPSANLKLYYWGRAFAMPAILVLFLLLFRCSKVITSIFGFIGAMSFEIYLAHFCILKAGSGFGAGMSVWMSLLVKLSISFIGGMLAYYLVTRPISRMSGLQRTNNLYMK